MKRSHTILYAALAALVCSCIPSLNPFYTSTDIVFDARLLGEWQEAKEGNPEIWKFDPGKTNDYKLTIAESKGKTGEFDAHLFRLKQEYFLDLIPTDCEYATNQADLVAASMFPGHLLVHVLQREPSLKLALCDFDWLEKFLKNSPNALAHHTEHDRIILTAGTRELQQFVLEHLGEGELFGEPAEMVRKGTDATPAK